MYIPSVVAEKVGNLTLEEFMKPINTFGVSQFVAFKNLYPLLKDSKESSYSLISGGLGALLELRLCRSNGPEFTASCCMAWLSGIIFTVCM